MRRVYIAGDVVEAHIVLHQLERVGVVARVLNLNAVGGTGEIPFTHAYPEVWVEEEGDYARARAIVAQYEASRAQSGTWLCTHCGETNPKTFELCWSCGTPGD